MAHHRNQWTEEGRKQILVAPKARRVDYYLDRQMLAEMERRRRYEDLGRDNIKSIHEVDR